MASSKVVIPTALNYDIIIKNGQARFTNLLFDPNSVNKIYNLKIVKIHPIEKFPHDSICRLQSSNIHGSSLMNYNSNAELPDTLAIFRASQDYEGEKTPAFLISTNKELINIKVEKFEKSHRNSEGQIVENVWISFNEFSAILTIRLSSSTV